MEPYRFRSGPLALPGNKDHGVDDTALQADGGSIKRTATARGRSTVERRLALSRAKRLRSHRATEEARAGRRNGPRLEEVLHRRRSVARYTGGAPRRVNESRAEQHDRPRLY